MSRGHPIISSGGVEISQLPDRFVSIMPTMLNVLLDADNEEENCSVGFDAGVYDPEGLRKFINRFIAFLDVVSRQPDIRIEEAIALTDNQ
jgi:hypothetical protein